MDSTQRLVILTPQNEKKPFPLIPERAAGHLAPELVFPQVLGAQVWAMCLGRTAPGQDQIEVLFPDLPQPEPGRKELITKQSHGILSRKGAALCYNSAMACCSALLESASRLRAVTVASMEPVTDWVRLLFSSEEATTFSIARPTS